VSESVFKLGVVKLGCIGAAPLLDLMLDERAARKDLAARAFTSGAKLDPESCAGPVADALRWGPDLALVVSPNATLPGPSEARAAFLDAGVPVVAIGDSPSKKAFFSKNEEGKQVPDVPAGLGFILLPADPMIGARAELLDPTEMVLFNTDVLRVLSATGAIRALQEALDSLIADLVAGGEAPMPALTITAERAVAAGGFGNPYAGAKALAALKMAEAVPALTTKACFVEQDPAKYVPLAAAAHELMRAAARLADEARELEKGGDTLLRSPHASSGEVRRKTSLGAKPA